MSEPFQLSPQEVANLRAAREIAINTKAELKKMLAAGVPPDDIKRLEIEADDSIAKIDKILKVYGG